MFRSTFVWCVLLLTPIAAAAQAKKDVAKIQQATAQDYAFLAQAGQIIGTLHELDVKKGTMTLRVEYQHPVVEAKNLKPAPKPAKRPQPKKVNRNDNRKRVDKNKNQQHGDTLPQLLKQRQEVMKIQNPAERQRRWQQLMQQIQQAQVREMQKDMQELQQKLRQVQANTPNVRLETALKEIDLPFATTVAVRRWDLPLAYDSKGNIKEYTKEEIDTLRGEDKSKPGFPATLADLHAGQVVRLHLAQATVAAGRPQVAMVLVLVDSYDVAGNKKNKK